MEDLENKINEIDCRLELCEDSFKNIGDDIFECKKILSNTDLESSTDEYLSDLDNRLNELEEKLLTISTSINNFSSIVHPWITSENKVHENILERLKRLESILYGDNKCQS